MSKLSKDNITLTVQAGESQFHLARRAFILLAKLNNLPPSEQIAFADEFVPLRLNTPNFKLVWENGSDPSPKDERTVKAAEFNKVVNQKITIVLRDQEKNYLLKRLDELKISGNRSLTFSSVNSLYNFGNSYNISLWQSKVYSDSKENQTTSTKIENTWISDGLRTALRLLETEAFNFGTRYINDAEVRQDYLKQTKQVSEELLEAFMRGEINEKQAADFAYQLRNRIMDASRLRTSDIGLAKAQSLKLNVEPLSFYEEKYAQKFFKKSFSELNATQRNKIWLEIVESSARPNAPVTATTVRLNRLGKGLVVVSFGISVYNIATAENKVKATAKEGTTLLGGFAGGAAGGAVAGLACGPGAPVCVTVGVFVGGILGALATDYAFDSIW